MTIYWRGAILAAATVLAAGMAQAQTRGGTVTLGGGNQVGGSVNMNSLGTLDMGTAPAARACASSP